MAGKLWRYAVHYLKSWGTPVVPVSPRTDVPVSPWSVYAEKGMTVEELLQLLRRADSKWKRGWRLTVATGPYQSAADRVLVVVDLDAFPEGVSRDDAARALADAGYPVALTPRGLHVYAFLEKSRPYMLVARGGGEGQRLGEGASLQPHLWTTPPAVRFLEREAYVYRWLLPGSSGPATPESPGKVQPPLLQSVRDLEGDLSTAIPGLTLREYRPAAEPPASPAAEAAVAAKRPLFRNMEEFLARAPEYPLPLTVAWVLREYHRWRGETAAAGRLAARMHPLCAEKCPGKVPEGARFLVAAEFTLFTAHLVDTLRLDEILEVLSAALENWPADRGENLDRKVSRLLLRGPDNTVEPRYHGLGSLNPRQVLGDTCSLCPLHPSCARRIPPWSAYRALAVSRGSMRGRATTTVAPPRP